MTLNPVLQHLLYSAVPAGAGTRVLRHSSAGCPVRAVPIIGVPGLRGLRPSSTVERRVNARGGEGETATDGAIFSDTARVDDEGRSSGSERDFLSTRPTPVIESQ